MGNKVSTANLSMSTTNLSKSTSNLSKEPQNKKITLNENAEKSASKWKFLDKLKRHEKITFALFGIVTLYFFCNTFYVTEEILKAALKKNKPSYRRNFEILSRFMRVLNACSNVFVYCVADQKFRRYLRYYLKKLFYPLFCKMIPILEPRTVDESSTANQQSRTLENSGIRTPLSTRKQLPTSPLARDSGASTLTVPSR